MKKDVTHTALREGWLMLRQIAHCDKTGGFVIRFHTSHLSMFD
uniref:Uncharacterized protein n=1 Tax=mine drainage metagenome TaxID=410659 RepID=E6PLG9_9ZZZZ